MKEVLRVIIEKMQEECVDCGALMFSWEVKRKKENGFTFSLCCSYGSIKLDKFLDPPIQLQKLYLALGKQGKQFRENIRQYNGLVSMASKNITGVRTNFNNTRGPNIFKMSGQMYHLAPSHIFPTGDKKPKFSQIYVYDQDNEIANRIGHATDRKKIDTNTLKIIQKELKEVNFFVQRFKSAADIFEAHPAEKLKMVFKSKGSAGSRKKHMNPDISDVVVIAPGEQTEPRDVILYRNVNDHPNQNETTRMDENHVMYDPTAYPLILPFGDYGFSIDRNIANNSQRNINANLLLISAIYK